MLCSIGRLPGLASAHRPRVPDGCRATAPVRARAESDRISGGYRRATRRAVWSRPDVLSWHVAASCFKYAAILAYNLQLSRRGRLRDPIYEELQGTMAGLLEDGRAVLDHGLTAFWPDAHAPQA